MPKTSVLESVPRNDQIIPFNETLANTQTERTVPEILGMIRALDASKEVILAHQDALLRRLRVATYSPGSAPYGAKPDSDGSQVWTCQDAPIAPNIQGTTNPASCMTLADFKKRSAFVRGSFAKSFRLRVPRTLDRSRAEIIDAIERTERDIAELDARILLLEEELIDSVPDSVDACIEKARTLSEFLIDREHADVDTIAYYIDDCLTLLASFLADQTASPSICHDAHR